MLELLTPVAGWALGKVADTLWESGTDYVKATLSKPQLSQALKDSLVAVREWEKTLPTPKLLFFSCDERRAGQFLERVFVDAGVVEQLQQPLAQQGEPDRELLRRYFEAVAAETNTKIVAASLPAWLGVFCRAYFEKTALFIKYQLGRQRYLQQLAAWYDDVKFLGISVASQEHEKSRKLLQIFVMPDVKARPAEGARRQAEREMAAELDTRQAQLLAEQRQLSALLAQEGKTFSARDLLGQAGSGRCVLLGAPGSGKTTLVSYFAVMLAQGESQREAPAKDLAAAGLAADALPLVVRIREWVEKRELGLLAFAQWFAETRLQLPGLPAGFFEYWLEQGKALILLDGLDEVANEAHRDEVVNQIECFLQQEQYRQNPAIITSRPAGYKQAYFRTEEFAHYDLQPFDEEKIGQFIENWYDNRESDPEVSQRHQAELKQALAERDRIQLLAKNPLLLTIITLIHRYEAYLPRKRHQLYNRAVETLLTNWDANKDLRAWPLDYLKRDALRRLMERLAYWIHTQGSAGDSEGGTLIDRAELIDQLSGFIAEEAGIRRYEAENEAERFLAYIRGRTGLLNEQGQDCYAFVHKTFQEYLAAEEINYQHKEEGFEVVESHLSQHLHTAHWEEVLLLLIAQQPKKRVAQLIQQILAHPTPYEQWLHRNLFFAAACLAEDVQLSDEKLVNSVLEPLMEMVASTFLLVSSRLRGKANKSLRNLGGTGFEENARSLLEARASQIAPVQLQLLQAALGQKTAAVQGLLALLKDTEYPIPSRALEALTQIKACSNEVLSSLLGLFEGLDPRVRFSVAEALGKLGVGSSKVLSSLLGLLKDSDSNVRFSAAYALEELGVSSSEVLSTLLDLLKDPDSSVRFSAACALGQLGVASNELLNTLLEMTKDLKSDVRSSAADALGRLGIASDEVLSTLLKMTKDSESKVRSSVAKALGYLGSGSNEVSSSLLELLKDSDYNVRFSAADSLGQLGSKSDEMLSGLLKLLEDSEYHVRHKAAEALGQLKVGSDEVLSSLLELLKAPEPIVRYGAAEALGQIGVGSDKVLSSLLELLKAPEPIVRYGAAGALGGLGVGSEELLQCLLELLKDTEFVVRYQAANVLVQVGQQALGAAERVAGWVEQHQEEEFVSVGVDVLWQLVTEQA